MLLKDNLTEYISAYVMDAIRGSAKDQKQNKINFRYQVDAEVDCWKWRVNLEWTINLIAVKV